MRRIGLIGGMSWESTALYYKRLNEQVRAALGGLHSADVVLRSVDFHTIAAMQSAGEWDRAGATLAEVARELEAAGAEVILLCTNTMHKVFGTIEAAVSVPLLHIGDVTGDAIHAQGCTRPLLLGTAYTMEQDFYRERIGRRFGLDVRVPDADDRASVHGIIYEELCLGVIRPESKARYLDIVAKARADGADGVILGCTEIGLLIGPDDMDVPTFDTTLLHADAAVAFAIDGRRVAA